MTSQHPFLSAVSANSVGAAMYCKGFDHILITIGTSGLVGGKSFNANFQISNEDTKPDFSSARSISNMWDYVQAIKVSDGTPVDGETGDPFATTDSVRTYEINTNGATWINVVISALVGAGITITAKGQAYNETE